MYVYSTIEIVNRPGAMAISADGGETNSSSSPSSSSAPTDEGTIHLSEVYMFILLHYNRIWN